jgi:hypothetical protein
VPSRPAGTAAALGSADSSGAAVLGSNSADGSYEATGTKQDRYDPHGNKDDVALEDHSSLATAANGDSVKAAVSTENTPEADHAPVPASQAQPGSILNTAAASLPSAAQITEKLPSAAQVSEQLPSADQVKAQLPPADKVAEGTGTAVGAVVGVLAGLASVGAGVAGQSKLVFDVARRANLPTSFRRA